MLRRLVGLFLAAAILALAPAAQASPPDQSWISGLYDNADFDDVVLLITSNLGAVELGIVWSLRPVARVIGLVMPMEREHQAARYPLFSVAALRSPESAPITSSIDSRPAWQPRRASDVCSRRAGLSR